ncbi:MAG: hypothetical protein NTX35_02135 [Verrucomicrobia bacterium]|nr:hypothetical protein [Verrucomicrobiota bacterium]
MSIELLKQEIATLPQERRNELLGYLIDLRGRETDPSYAERTTALLNDKNSSRWIPWHEVERRLDAIDVSEDEA